MAMERCARSSFHGTFKKTHALKMEWDILNIKLPRYFLDVVPSPFRELERPYSVELFYQPLLYLSLRLRCSALQEALANLDHIFDSN